MMYRTAAYLQMFLRWNILLKIREAISPINAT